MTRNPGFAVDEIRGRMLHDALLSEARTQISTWCEGVPVTIPPHQDPPAFPRDATTDTGSVRAVVAAS